MLGHWHRIEGRVQHGDKRGKALGFPTANLCARRAAPAALRRLRRARRRARRAAPRPLPRRRLARRAADLRRRQAPNLEVYLLDFDGDLYGAALSVALVAFQRPELMFDAAAPLVAQMRDDVAEARSRLAWVRP